MSVVSSHLLPVCWSCSKIEYNFLRTVGRTQDIRNLCGVRCSKMRLKCWIRQTFFGELEGGRIVLPTWNTANT